MVHAWSWPKQIQANLLRHLRVLPAFRSPAPASSARRPAGLYDFMVRDGLHGGGRVMVGDVTVHGVGAACSWRPSAPTKVAAAAVPRPGRCHDRTNALNHATSTNKRQFRHAFVLSYCRHAPAAWGRGHDRLVPAARRGRGGATMSDATSAGWTIRSGISRNIPSPRVGVLFMGTEASGRPAGRRRNVRKTAASGRLAHAQEPPQELAPAFSTRGQHTAGMRVEDDRTVVIARLA
jgi:hypothetical protein